MSSPHHSRLVLGQNFIRDRAVINAIVDIVSRTDGPIIEIGAGDGALTLPLQTLGRPLIAIEIDARRVARLSSRTAASTRPSRLISCTTGCPAHRTSSSATCRFT